MEVCVQGLWHLGSVTAACLASVGHDVIGLDTDQTTIDGLAQGRAISAACEGLARNPGAAAPIRFSLLLGLVLIESLALYTLFIIFVKVV